MADRYALVVDSTNNNIKEIPAADRLVADNLLLSGTTPTLTIGDAGAEDTKIVFDGNAQDFYIGLDDSADDLLIGLGSAVGTTPAISIDENQDVVANQEFRAVSYNETYVAPTSSSNATTIACESGNYFKHTLTENTTFTFSNPPASGTGFSFVLHLIQDSSARTVTWPNSCLLYTSPSPRDRQKSRMPSSA